MNELIRKHSDLSSSIIKRAKVTLSHLKTVNWTLNLLLWTLWCFLGYLTYLGDALSSCHTNRYDISTFAKFN